MARAKNRKLVTVVKVRHDGPSRLQRAYHQLWRWVKQSEVEDIVKSNENKE